MPLLVRFLRDEKPGLDRHEIRLRAIGRLDRLPEPSRGELAKVCDSTATHGKMTLTLALSYGGRDEIVDAARALARDVKAGRLAPEAVDAAALPARLYAPDMPDPDLLVRTSGEMRVSNFLLWQIAYAE